MTSLGPAGGGYIYWLPKEEPQKELERGVWLLLMDI